MKNRINSFSFCSTLTRTKSMKNNWKFPKKEKRESSWNKDHFSFESLVPLEIVVVTNCLESI